MDNFDLHSYLRHNPLFEASEEEVKEEFWAVDRPNGEVVKYFKSEKEAQFWIRKNDPEGMVDYQTRQIEEAKKTKMTKSEFKAMVKEMALTEIAGETPELPKSTLTQLNSNIIDISTLAKSMLDIYNQIKDKEQIDFSKNATFGTVLKNLEKLSKPTNKPVTENEEELEEMARIATNYKLVDNFEEMVAKMPENKQKSSRYSRVINYLKDNEVGTLKSIADEEFRTSETAAVSPIMSDLVSYGVVEKAGLVAPKKEKSVGDGTRGRKMSDVGRVKSALEKFKAGDSEYTDEERVALKTWIDSISATL